MMNAATHDQSDFARLRRDFDGLRRIVDHMLTAHSVLRDRYEWRAKVADIVSTSISVLLTAFIFVDNNDASLRQFFGVNDMPLLIQLLSLASALLVPAVARLNWSGLAAKHEQSARTLSKFKVRLKAVAEASFSASAYQDAHEDWKAINETIAQIPDAEFVALKAYHAHKVAVSKAIDSHPGVPAWLISLRLRRDAVLYGKSPSTTSSQSSGSAGTVNPPDGQT